MVAWRGEFVLWEPKPSNNPGSRRNEGREEKRKERTKEGRKDEKKEGRKKKGSPLSGSCRL